MMLRLTRPQETKCFSEKWFISFIDAINVVLSIEQPGSMSYLSFLGFLYLHLGEIEPEHFGDNGDSFAELKIAIREEW